MPARFVVRERARTGSAANEYLVVDTRDRSRPVASFASRDDAEAHADRLEAGPLDWDEQEQWKDDDDDDGWGTGVW